MFTVRKLIPLQRFEPTCISNL